MFPAPQPVALKTEPVGADTNLLLSLKGSEWNGLLFCCVFLADGNFRRIKTRDVYWTNTNKRDRQRVQVCWPFSFLRLALALALVPLYVSAPPRVRHIHPSAVVGRYP